MSRNRLTAFSAVVINIGPLNGPQLSVGKRLAVEIAITRPRTLRITTRDFRKVGEIAKMSCRPEKVRSSCVFLDVYLEAPLFDLLIAFSIGSSRF
jgi:hypothetical protein